MRDRLSQMRQQKQMSQASISEKAGISLKSYQRIEKDKQIPSVDIAKRIAQILGCRVEDIF